MSTTLVYSDEVEVGAAPYRESVRVGVTGFERGSVMLTFRCGTADVNFHLSPRDFRAMAAAMVSCADTVAPIDVLEAVR